MQHLDTFFFFTADHCAVHCVGAVQIMTGSGTLLVCHFSLISLISAKSDVLFQGNKRSFREKLREKNPRVGSSKSLIFFSRLLISRF